jgi:heme a synthase
VIGQGVLGGLRVVLSDRTLAMLHGCSGPAFFALCVATAAVSGRWWWTASDRVSADLDQRKRFGWGMLVAVGGLVLLSYLQLVLGAQLRHAQPTLSPSGFAHIVKTHVGVALVLWVLTGFVWSGLRKCGDLTLSRPALILVGLVLVQILLGIATWVVNYGWPTILQWVPGSSDYIVQSKGFSESIIVTGHVATGSLILAVSTLTVLRVARMRFVASQSLA